MRRPGGAWKFESQFEYQSIMASVSIYGRVQIHGLKNNAFQAFKLIMNAEK